MASLTSRARDYLLYALTSKPIATEVADSIDLADKYIPQPRAAVAAGAAIPVDRSAVYGLVVAASQSETNTLANPTFVGQELGIIIDTLGSGGSRVITAAGAINQTGNNTLTFAQAEDFILLKAVTIGGALRWRVVANDGVSLSTV